MAEEAPKKTDVKLGRTGNRPQWLRTGSVFVRAVHLVGAGALLGGYLFGVERSMMLPYVGIAAMSGLVLIGTEFARHRELYREVAGWSTIVKLLILLTFPLFPDSAGLLMILVFLIAAIGAHLPRRYRHRLLF